MKERRQTAALFVVLRCQRSRRCDGGAGTLLLVPLDVKAMRSERPRVATRRNEPRRIAAFNRSATRPASALLAAPGLGRNLEAQVRAGGGAQEGGCGGHGRGPVSWAACIATWRARHVD